MHFMEWGDSAAPTLVMWHGLARTGRDFDILAAAMARDYRVICPDTLGRGLSQWAADRDSEYCYEFYGRMALSLCEQLGVDQLRWIGTSMGGSLGIDLAAGKLKGRISHLVINDIGPELPEAAVQRIADYIGNPPTFATIGELEGWLRTIYIPFGDNPEIYWRTMADTSHRRTDDGQVTVHYDPAIVSQFTLHRADLDLWDAYDRIDCPTLLLRGAESDLLPVSVAQAMAERGPKARVQEFAGFGHAPSLGSSREHAVIKEFLDA
jgi:pimeloyl-ACP methyl ester carboxylesterase